MRIRCVRIGPGNRGVLVNCQGRDDLRKDVVWIQIWVMTVVAIAGPPAVVDGKLRQVSEPVPNQGGVNSCGSAPHQGAKRIEICRSLSVGHQIRIQKLVMSDLIVSIVVDVLSHIFIQYCEGGGVERIACSTWHLRILNSAEFVVLNPKVRLE